ncbi:hypothetical protein GOBAR_AA13803 [Gossypium barbadense]|uniref:Uncharacterized protein n=1 Tax=Gossypium barbadense TaxID=3634 RepID=A0A2P5XU26_GOSBA|nr:hypothetical protein GOBAR_AA13803 [Gossypium barbadense]
MVREVVVAMRYKGADKSDRIIGQDPNKSGGGYSGGGRGSLVHKSSAKRILYLVVAMVVVEQDMAVVENLF